MSSRSSYRHATLLSGQQTDTQSQLADEATRWLVKLLTVKSAHRDNDGQVTKWMTQTSTVNNMVITLHCQRVDHCCQQLDFTVGNLTSQLADSSTSWLFLCWWVEMSATWPATTINHMHCFCITCFFQELLLSSPWLFQAGCRSCVCPLLGQLGWRQRNSNLVILHIITDVVQDYGDGQKSQYTSKSRYSQWPWYCDFLQSYWCPSLKKCQHSCFIHNLTLNLQLARCSH